MLNIKAFQFNMFGVNTYVVWDPVTLDSAIIDPGMINRSEEAVLDSFVEKEKLNVTQLVNTHMHVDHTFGVPHIRNRYGIELKASPDDTFLGRQAPAQARMFGLDASNVEPVEANVALSDGDHITVGSEEAIVLGVPGHSPGSLVLYFPHSAFVITGDVLFEGSIGRTDLVAGNHQQLLDGIKRKLLSLPDNTKVYPGHGSPTTIGAEKKSNPYLQ